MSEDERKLFPQALTFFTTKKDANYDGDPEGDYVLAEHMNKVQEAINRIEKSIGTFPSSQGTVTENIHILKNERPMRVDSVGYFTGTLSGNTSAIQSALSQYHLVLLDTVDLNTKGVVEYLSNQGIDVFGVVDAREPLQSVQNNVNNWKNQGAKGILLNHFGGEESPTRVNQQKIIDSISQEEMQVAIAPVNINELIDILPFKKQKGVIFVGSGEYDQYLNRHDYDLLIQTLKKAGNEVRAYRHQQGHFLTREEQIKIINLIEEKAKS